MAECSVCGDDSSLSFTCKRCTKEFCSTHQLPENHNCVGLHLFGMGGWFSEKFEKSSDGIADSGDSRETVRSPKTVKKPDFRSKSDQGKIQDTAVRKREGTSDHFGKDASSEANPNKDSKSAISDPRKPDFTERSPDVNPDGSISRAKDDNPSEGVEEKTPLVTRLRQRLPFSNQRGENLSDAELERRKWQRKRKHAHRKARLRAFIYSLPLFALKAMIGAAVLLLALDYLL